MAKRTKQDDETLAAIEQLENEGGAIVDTTNDYDEPRFIVYRGGHPLIRRCGYAFEPNRRKCVPAGIAAVLVAVRDFEDATPSTPGKGEADLPPAA